MNRQPNRTSNSSAVNVPYSAFKLLHSYAAFYLSPKENPMNRRIATVLFSLFALLILSACAMPSPFQTTGSVTVLPKVAAADMQISDRQQLAEYQANLTAFSLVAVAPKTAVKASGLQINDRQQLAEYQASLPVYVVNATRYTGVQQINDLQELAEYQATLR